MHVLAVLLLVALALRFLRRAHEPDRDGNATVRLWAPAAVLFVIGIAGLDATLRHVANPFWREHPANLTLGALLAAAGLLGAAFCTAYRVTLTADAVIVRRPPWSARRLALDAVTGIEQDTPVSAVICFRDGRRVAVPRVGSGTPGFLRALAVALDRLGRPIRLLERIRRAQ